MLKVVKSGACMAMVIVASLVAGATIFNTAHAEDPHQDAGVDYTVNVAPSLKVTLSSNNVVLNLNPNTHTSDSGDLDVSISTNNATGYKLSMSSTGDATALARNATADGKTASIPTLSAAAGTTPASLTDNTWGYRLSETDNFTPYVSGVQIMDSSAATNNDEATVSFASKINYSQAAGTYSLGLTLAAVSNPPISYLQDVTNTTCPTTPTIAVDKRDNQEYTIAKIGTNCWMTQNLRYVGDTGSTSGSMIMKADTSNIASDQTLTIGDLTLGNDYDNARIHVATADQVPSGASYTATDMGVWYNYAAASAGFVTSNQNSTTESTYSVCPAGWRLPTDSEQSGITSYESQYFNGGSAVTGGYYYSSSVDSTGNGYWWSSTSNGSNLRYNLHYSGSSLGTSNSGNRRVGIYVRCVLKDTRSSLSDISTMQEMNHDVVLNTAAGASKTLRDTRDDKTYTVAKLADGNVWMTENLNLAGGTALSADDTDVTSTYISGFTTGGNLTKNSTNNTISLPASTTSGFNNDSNAFVYNTTKTGTDCSSPGCYGYYSWIAATLGGKQADGSTAETRDGYNAAASICPKGWKLPTSTTSNASATASPNWKTGDFYKLATAYGANLESNYYKDAATFYNNAGPGKLPNFLLAGYYESGSFSGGGSGGHYWPSSSVSSTSAYYIYFSSSRVSSAGTNSRRRGFAVRCFAR